MKYLKLYENFSVGKTVYLILSKDRSKQLTHPSYHETHTSHFSTGELSDKTSLDDIYRKFQTKDQAQEVLDSLKVKKLNNMHVVSKRNTFNDTHLYLTKGTLYTNDKEFKGIIKEIKGKVMPISPKRIEEVYPFNYGTGWKNWKQASLWGSQHVTRRHAITDEQKAKYPNKENSTDFMNFLSTRNYEQISFDDYLSILNDFEVVPFFIGGYETDGPNI